MKIKNKTNWRLAQDLFKFILELPAVGFCAPSDSFLKAHTMGQNIACFKRYPLYSSLFLLTALFCILTPLNAYSAVSDTLAVRAIIGEAGNQGYTGMLAVAGAIRNRGTLRGVYGVKAKHVDKQPQWVWDMAKKAWNESETNDTTNGATHWENIKAFGKPYWVKSMVKVYEHKDHVFYKSK